MNKFKRLAALAAASLLGIQMLGVGTAFASGGTSECDFNDDSLEITLGDDSASYVYLYIDGTKLWCDDTSANGLVNEGQALSTIKSISVVMDDDAESTDMLEIDLEDGSTTDAADWPKFSSFDIDVYTEIYVNGDGVTNGGQSVRVTVGKSSLSFLGTTATLGNLVPSIEIDGSDGRDSIDASAAILGVDIEGNLGNDTIKGGSKRDFLDGEGGSDFVYGGAGNDDITCDGTNFDFGYGQDGNDYLYECWYTAPGAGDDEIDPTNVSRLSYSDLSGGMVYSDTDGCAYATTSGAAGDDILGTLSLDRFYGTQGDDVIVAYSDCIDLKIFAGGGNDVVRAFYQVGSSGPWKGDGIFGDAGNDKLFGSDYDGDILRGGPGDDVLKAKGDDDVLIGGPGQDQLWGGSGDEDMCKSGEVLDECENLTYSLI